MRKKVLYRIGYSGIVMLILISTFSCTDLEENVYDQFLVSDFYKNDNDIALAMSPVYADLRILFDWQRWWDLTSTTTDICMTPQRPTGWYDGGVYQRLQYHTWTPDDVHINWFWDNAYTGISDCNVLIYQVENSPFEIENSEALISEVRAVRAFWYYLLCDAYGNVPISTRFDVPADTLLPTVKRKEVVDFIISELKYSLPHLSPENTTKTYGRMNKWAASYILAITYLNSEVWTGVAKYDSCMMYCDSILAQEPSRYSLEANYRDLFIIENQNSRETIFNVPMDELIPGAIIYIAYRYTLHFAEKDRYHFESWLDNGIVAGPSFIDSFDSLDQRGIINFHKGQRYNDKGDTLRDENGVPVFYTKEVPYMGDEPGALLLPMSGYRLHKYEIEDGAKIECNNDWVWFRLAYVKFMKAECLLRTGSDADLAAELVNSVRQRSFPANVWEEKKYTAADLTATIEVNGVATQFGELLNEYAREFCYESWRRNELIRFGNFVTGTWSLHAPSDDPNRNLYPIPTSALVANPNLEQNLGY